MHEMSLCESVLDILEQQALAQHFSRVKTVWLEIGQLSSVEPDAMRFCFDVVTKNTLAEHARLEIIATSGSAWCLPCGQEVAIQTLYDACPHCGSAQLQVVSGDAMRIKELEVE